MEPFALLVGIGATLGLVQVARDAPRPTVIRWLNAALLTLFSAMIGARLYFVALHFNYFRGHVLEAPQFWLGGMDWPGAILGGFVALAALAISWAVPVGRLADRMALMIPPLAVMTWLGCWQVGCGYGWTTDGFGIPTLAEDGTVANRFPVQLLAAFSLLAYYAWLDLKAPGLNRSGQRGSLIGLGLAANLLVFSFLRADPVPVWGSLRSDTWTALVFTVLMAGACLYTFGIFEKTPAGIGTTD